MRLCEYKDVAGLPGQGFHTHFAGLAIFDVIGTIIVAFLVAKLANLSPIVVIVVAFILGIFAHWLFCVDTALNKFLGLT